MMLEVQPLAAAMPAAVVGPPMLALDAKQVSRLEKPASCIRVGRERHERWLCPGAKVFRGDVAVSSTKHGIFLRTEQPLPAEHEADVH